MAAGVGNEAADEDADEPQDAHGFFRRPATPNAMSLPSESSLVVLLRLSRASGLLYTPRSCSVTMNVSTSSGSRRRGEEREQQQEQTVHAPLEGGAGG